MLMLLTSPMQHIQTPLLCENNLIVPNFSTDCNWTKWEDTHDISHISKLQNKNKKQVNCKAQERDTHVMLH